MKQTVTDTYKQKQLRQHKAWATGLFILMVLVYVLSIYLMKHNHYTVLGYIKAFSEAAMVGALADWFAVTALFHHPLGLKIPHTNLIEKSKTSIGNNLGDFVVENFLTPQNIRPYIQQLKVSSYAADWLLIPKNNQALVKEITQILQSVLSKIDDYTVTHFLTEQSQRLLSALPLPDLLSKGLLYLIERGEQEKAITTLAQKIKEYIIQNQDIVQDKVHQESYFFIPKFVDKKVAEKISHGFITFFEEIEKDPQHRIRKEITMQLRQFAIDLPLHKEWIKDIEAIKNGLISTEKIQHYMVDVWQSIKSLLLEQSSQQESAGQQYISKQIAQWAQNLKTDEVLQYKIDHWIRVTAYRMVLKNTTKVAQLISDTVGNWEGDALSRKLELEVGKDLQFIRINGTLVGGLVGLLIYTLTQIFN
jgi:uncharacterized membrane-anchored protein YjiN (DUF445 family)